MVFGDMSKFFNHIRLILKYDNHPSVITEKMMDETGFLKVPGTMQLPKCWQRANLICD